MSALEGKALSCRGRQQLGKPLREDWAYMKEIEDDRYHPHKNIEGFIPLFIAENVLGWSCLRKKLATLPTLDKIDEWTFKYTNATGHPDFCTSLAQFAAKNIAGPQFQLNLDPELFAVSSGATAILELISWILCDSGDVVGIPAPAYPVYTKDISIKANLERLDISPSASHKKTPGIHPVSLEDIKQATSEHQCKMIFLTQPDNPTGAIYTPQQLEEICSWAIDNQIHLVVNEIYSLSLIDITNETIANDYDSACSGVAFSSVLPIIEEKNSDYLHWIYSFSKDFGISGFRAGVLYSRNSKLIEAIGTVGAPHEVSNQTQWTLMKIIEDYEWVDMYAKELKGRLTNSYSLVVKMLKEFEIPYYASRGTLFVWINLSKYLSEESIAGEKELWIEIYKHTKCLLTGPGDFGNSERGWFRIVITSVETEELTEALSRLARYFETKSTK